MTFAEKRVKWERMGLCSNCGGLKLEPEFKTCTKCRGRSRAKMKAVYAKEEQTITPEKNMVLPEIGKNHKCWYCEWGRFEGDRFFCPFIEGTCIKNGNINISREMEGQDEE